MHEHASTINNNPVTKAGEMSMPSRPKRNESAKPQAASTQADKPAASVGNLVGQILATSRSAENKEDKI